MAKFSMTFSTTIELTVVIEADSEDRAADAGWTEAHNYLATLTGDGDSVTGADASIDGIGESSITEI